MRVSRQEMERSHQRILDGASRLMRERGIEGTSVGDVMTEAGLTQGGFYRHFTSKEALLAEALEGAFAHLGKALTARLESGDVDEAASGYRANYLSDLHVAKPGLGCPIAALAGDIARGPKALKAAFGGGVNRVLGLLARVMSGTPAQQRARAARELAMLVGAVVIARASDAETGREVLEACRVPVSEETS